LTAVQKALEIAPRHREVLIVTDSKYAINCLTVWYKGWRQNDWKTSQSKDVLNKDLILDITNKIEERARLGAPVNFEWIKGHSNDPGNDAADQLAMSGALIAKELSSS
jgi:ribonuclease HI